MMARGEDLVLKISADTSAVAHGLQPMTKALDTLERQAGDAEKELSKVSDVRVVPDVDARGIAQMERSLNSLEREIDATRDAMRDLDRTEVTLDVKEEAITRARTRIDELREEIAQNVILGVSTKEAERQLTSLQSSVKKLTDTPAVVDVEVDIPPGELRGVEALREGAFGISDAFGQADGSLTGFVGIAREAVPALSDLNETMTSIRERNEQAGQSMGRLGKATSAVTSFMAGPWGLAVAVGTGLIGAFASKQSAASTEAENLSKAIDRQAGAFDKNNRQNAAKLLQDKGALDAAEALGVSTEDLTTALLRQVDITKLLKDAQLNVTTDKQRGQLIDLATAYDSVSKTMGTTAVQQDQLKRAVGGASAVINDQTESLKTQQSYWDKYTKQIDDAQSELDKLVGELDLFNGRTADARKALVDYRADVAKSTEFLREHRKELGRNRQDFALSTEAGRQADEMIRGMAEDIATLTTARIEDAQNSGQSTDAIMADYGQQKRALVDTAVQMGLSRSAAEKYVDQLLKVPTDTKTKVALTGINAAEQDMKDLTKERTAMVKVHVDMSALKEFNLETARGNVRNITVRPSVQSAPAPSSASAGPSTVILQPRLFLDSQPIRAAMRGDIQQTVTSTVAATRTRGRLG